MPVSARSLFSFSLVAAVQAATHEVSVGKGGLKFDPEVIKAGVGDTITYNFFAKNHSVVQSSFKEPCQPLADGFFSGFVPAESADEASTTKFTIEVKDDKPIWVYCSQTNGDHCQKGMVHAINPPETGNTLDAYKDAAKDAKTSKSPADGLPKGGIRRKTIEVGMNGLTFEPNNIVEPKGTVISFNFNPKNHTVTQSSFDEPCQPVDDGFSSGFIPISVSPSGIQFEVTVEKEDPIWFYCGQGNHCQSGMVGAVNAPPKKTINDFTSKAKSAKSPNSIPSSAPLKGRLLINGTSIPEKSFNGAVLPASLLPSSPTTTSAPSDATQSPGSTPTLPPPGPDTPEYYTNIAGGGKPAHYNWASNISSDATTLLQLHERIEDIILHLLWDVYAKLSPPHGAWDGVYPDAIVHTIRVWAAQSLVHRATVAEVLQHYEKSVPKGCRYKLPTSGDVDQFLEAFNKLNALQIAAAVDSAARVAESEPFLVPLLMGQVGAKSRAAGVVNMMLNRVAAAAPREVGLPAKLAWSYVMGQFVESGGCEDKIDGMPDKTWPSLGVEITSNTDMLQTVVNVELKYDVQKDTEGQVKVDHFVAWLGPYGMLDFSAIDGETEQNATKRTVAPARWYGDVWAVVVDQDNLKLEELADHVVAGPEMFWIREPCGRSWAC